MTFKEVLNKYRAISFTEKEKGTKFERLMRSWLLTDPRYERLTHVWMWNDFPSKSDFGGKDVGIDLVAKTELGEYWAIQCKCYQEDAVIDKPSVDSFLATSSRTFKDPDTFQTTSFSNRLWISTTNHWGTNAEEAIRNQNPPVSRIGLVDLETSPVDWGKLEEGDSGTSARAEGKQPMEHQLRAISAAVNHFKENDRGKLVMACGTGKTYTSLQIAETMLDHKGLVLFLVPSISLLGQALNAWYGDSKETIKAVCICSDNKAQKKISKDSDDVTDSAVDLALPSSTNAKSISRQLISYKNHNGLVVVFSTYQSIDAVSEAQKEVLKASNGTYGEFDLIVCDEAHRTTGIKLSEADESNFTKVHSNDNVRGKKRLYMTATPRLYGESAKVKASEKNCILCSMDDEAIYGKEFFRVNFSYAVNHGLLTDYKVLVLTVSEDDIPDNIKADVRNNNVKELNYDETTKLIGVINGLSKEVRGDDGKTWAVDPQIMHRAVAFCSAIGSEDKVGTSKNIAYMLPRLCEKYRENLSEEEQKRVVHIKTKHIDGSQNALERNQSLAWLKDDSEDEQECKVLTNVRCLSEGIDVPALDAVLFLSSRNSQVDIVQSVGRIMRNFKKGQPGEKKYGYIIIPIVVPMDVSPEEALSQNKYFDVVWSILNALRSHDDNFNAEVNKIALNKNKDSKVLIGGAGFGQNVLDKQDQQDAATLNDAEIATQLEIRFGEMKEGIYAKLVEKCGDRLYWENWAKEVGTIARKFIERITQMVLKEGIHKAEFDEYVKGLQKNLNPSISEAQAIEMLAQHIITRPVFDALFKDYEFVKNNAVSRSMQQIIDLLEEEGLSKDLASLEKFYDSVRSNVSNIDNLGGKQTVIKNLYEKFFKGAFPLTVEQLGIVYTPIECVDFILHSVEYILKKEFDTSLTEENVHFLDPFTGTGTFVTRLLQSGLIKKEDMKRKYLNEIHCNELVLLAYYIADVNIESVYHDIMHPDEYLPYDGICLTDTFQLNEDDDRDIFSHLFKENSERVEIQKKAPVRVIASNPPYSIGQKSANDNAQNLSYDKLDKRIAETYVKNSSANLTKSLYDSYIKAFRWASDRISQIEDGGIVAFISNGAWIDGNGQDGFRKCLEKEFTSIYVLNLRGNARTSGELRRREGGGIFDAGSRTCISITLLVKNPNVEVDKATIYYHDIGDYLTREDKLRIVKGFKSIASKRLDWQIIRPNEKGDWINQRDGLFDTLIPLLPDKNFNVKSQSVFNTVAIGVATNRDAWDYNYSHSKLADNITNTIAFFNAQRKKAQELLTDNPSLRIDDYLNSDATKISWTVNLKKKVTEKTNLEFCDSDIIEGLYRPFQKQKLYYNRDLVERPGQWAKLYPSKNTSNLSICISGVGASKGFSALIIDRIPSLDTVEKCQCFPFYWYEENKHNQPLSLFDDETNKDYIRHDGITDWILKEVRKRFGDTKSLTKEHIFYYVYGLLHSQGYRERFADDLKRSLPRIPIMDRVDDFMSFYKAGKELAELHLNYEIVGPCPTVNIEYSVHPNDITDEDFYVEKMRFPSKEQKDTIIYNGKIRLTNIPKEAYDYVVNGKSAVEWLMERYAVTIDKNSLIKNDPNDWGKEHGKPRYILDLMLSVINVSVKTMQIVNSLPTLRFEGDKVIVEKSGYQAPKESEAKEVKIEIPKGQNEFVISQPAQVGIAADEEAPNGYNTLYLPIKQVFFDQIINGTKKVEYREVKSTTAKRYLVYADGKPKLNESVTDPSLEYELDDFNGGKFPFVPKQFKYLNLAVGYSQNRDTAIVEVEKITFTPDKIRANMFCYWIEEFHISRVVEVHRKK